MNRSVPTSLRRFWVHLAVFSRRRFLAGCGLNVVATFTSGVGVLFLIPLLHSAGWLPGSGAQGRTEQMLAELFSLTGLSRGSESALFAVVGMFAGIAISFASLDGLNQRFSSKYRLDYLFSLRMRLYELVSGSSWAYIARQSSSEIENMMSTGLAQLAVLTQLSLNFLSDFLLTVIYLALSCAVSPSMTALTVAIAGAGLWVSRRDTVYSQGEDAFRVSQKLHEALSRFLTGMKFAKSANAVPAYLSLFRDLNQQSIDIQLRYLNAQQETRRMFRLVSVLILAVLFLVALLGLKLKMATLVTVFLLYSRMMPRISSMQQAYLQMKNYAPIFDRYTAMFDEFRSHVDRLSSPRPITVQKSLRVDRLCYRHPSSSFCLGPVSFEVQLNSSVAIVGPSGAGKSTLVDLILGLLNPESGQILVDQTVLSPEYLASWRDQISYVPQNCFLINASVRENLLWPASPKVAVKTDESLWAALRLASAAEFVSELPDQLDARIGEQGVLLSGGQRQRIALARALLRKPKVLILDEATNALDTLNEDAIFKSLQNLRGRLTLLVISHRYETVRSSDQILVLNQGKLVESGAPEELLSDPGGHFAGLFDARLRGAVSWTDH